MARLRPITAYDEHPHRFPEQGVVQKNNPVDAVPGWRQVFSFPHPVNEVAARLVAAQVVLLVLAILISRQPWLVVFLAYGFLARVLSGPTLSPMGLFATRVLVPMLHLEPRLVAGPPKRFAQSIGLVFSLTAAVLWIGWGLQGSALTMLAALGLFAMLEAAFGFCTGCWLFGRLMKWGLVPKATCERCVSWPPTSSGE